MIFKLIFLPFRLNWLFTLAFALGLGYLAYLSFQTYVGNWNEARFQVREGAPDPTLLSKWSAATDVGTNNEVNVQGIYFTAIAQGSFDPVGMQRWFIPLADDRGREVKAVLVVREEDLVRLQRQLAAQGSGDRIPVTVNGTLNQSSNWEDLIWIELFGMDVPSSEDLVVIEPFIGARSNTIYDRAEQSFGMVVIFGALAALFGFVAVVKVLFALVRGRKSSATQSQMSGREAMAARQSKQPSRKSLPKSDAPQASPWGGFEPQARASTQALLPEKSKKTVPAKTQRKPEIRPSKEEIPPQPAFKSVFPGGASGFRFKSSDEIIRQSFGSLSSARAYKRSLKRRD